MFLYVLIILNRDVSKICFQPLFWQLAECWENLQDSAVVLAKQNQIVMTLQSYVTQLTVDEQLLKNVIGGDGVVCDADKLELKSSTSLCQLENPNSDITIIDPDDIDDFDSIQFVVSLFLFTFGLSEFHKF